MTDFSAIVRRNLDTFYNYRTNSRYSLKFRYAGLVIAAVGLSATVRAPSNDLYTGFVSVQALLVGFTFNLIFYLAGSGRLTIVNSDILEDQVEVKRLNKLGMEIFYNISYFNLVAVCAVILSLILLAFSGFRPFPCALSINTCKGLAKASLLAGLVSWHITLALAYFATLESTLTFIRLIRRVSSYFEDRATLLAAHA